MSRTAFLIVREKRNYLSSDVQWNEKFLRQLDFFSQNMQMY